MKKNKTSLSLIITISILLLWTFFLLSANYTLLSAFPLADKRLFLFINGMHNAFWDEVMYYASSKTFWIPFYVIVIFFLWKSEGKKVWQVLLAIAVLIFAADQLASHLVKNFIERLRPSHEPALAALIHLSKTGQGGLYGFVSSHAANTFALTVFLTLLLDKSYLPLKIVLFLWAFLVSYSRIYEGVHYPLDVLCGSILGALVGIVLYYLYQMVFVKQDGLQS